MNEKNKMIHWIKDHKKQLIIAGIGIAALIALVLGIKNKGTLKSLWASLKGTVEPTSEAITETVTQPLEESSTLLLSNDSHVPLEVRRHIRTLPEGWKASPEKIASALEYNIILTERQTWVDSYIKGRDVA